MKLNKVWTFQICQIQLNFLNALHRFCFRKYLGKCKYFSVFLPLKEPLVATLNETCPLKFRINVAKKGTTIPLISLCPKSKKEKCDQMDLNISDQLETLIPFSTIYFLGVRSFYNSHSFKYFLEVWAHFSLKVATKDSFRYKTVKKLFFLTLKLYKQKQRKWTKIISFSDHF